MPISKAISRWLFAIRKAKGPLRSQSEASKRRKALKGFTLIELLVAIVILGILAGIVARTNNISQQKARDAIRKKHLSEIAVALRAAYADKWDSPAKARNNYPAENGSCLGIASGTWGNVWSIGSPTATVYMERLPKDPKPVVSTVDYCYDISPDGQSFHLLARLEFAQDPDRNVVCDDQHTANLYNYCIDENGVIKSSTPLTW